MGIQHVAWISFQCFGVYCLVFVLLFGKFEKCIFKWFFFFFFNRADRKDIWSLHQIFIPSKEKLIKVFSVKKDDQRSSVLYHLRCQFHCMLMKGGSWMTQFPKSDLSSSIQPPLLLKSCQVHQSIWLCHEVTEQECSLKDCLHWVFKKIVLFFV